MSLDSTIARISQIETMLTPGAHQTSSAPAATSVATVPAGTSSGSFATHLQSALDTTAGSPGLTGTAGATAGSAGLTGTAGTSAVSPGLAASLAGAIAPAVGPVTTGSPASAVAGTSGSPASTVAPGTTESPAGAVAPASAGSPASMMVRIAESQIGEAEQPPGSNDSAQIAQYRTATVGAQAGEPWCAYFASWVAQQAGMPLGDQGQGFGYVGDIWSWAQQTGRAIPNGPGVTPQPGDLIVFGDHHVGIVDKVVANGDVQTVEGNYSNQVSQVIRGPGEATGYVRMG